MRKQSGNGRSWLLPLCAVGAGVVIAYFIPRYEDLFTPKHVLLILVIVLLLYTVDRLRKPR